VSSGRVGSKELFFEEKFAKENSDTPTLGVYNITKKIYYQLVKSILL